MDLSKLPKLSNTPKPPDNEPPEVPQLDYATPITPTPGAEAILSLLIGLILLLMQQNLLQQFGHWCFGMELPLPFIDNVTGQQFAYTQTSNFIVDLGLGIFALALIIEGLTLFIRHTVVLVPSFLMMVLAGLWNLFVVAFYYPRFGLQIMPAVAVVFAIYISMIQWKMLTFWLRTRRGRPDFA